MYDNNGSQFQACNSGGRSLRASVDLLDSVSFLTNSNSQL